MQYGWLLDNDGWWWMEIQNSKLFQCENQGAWVNMCSKVRCFLEKNYNVVSWGLLPHIMHVYNIICLVYSTQKVIVLLSRFKQYIEGDCPLRCTAKHSLFDQCFNCVWHCGAFSTLRRILWLHEIRRSRGCETSAFGDLQTMASGPPNFRDDRTGLGHHSI